MKKFILGAALAVLVASPALAQPRHHADYNRLDGIRAQAPAVNSGAVYVDGRPTAPPDVEAVLARHVARDPRTSVSLHADRNEPFGTVAAVIASIGRARVAHVAIATADGESGTAH